MEFGLHCFLLNFPMVIYITFSILTIFFDNLQIIDVLYIFYIQTNIKITISTIVDSVIIIYFFFS